MFIKESGTRELNKNYRVKTTTCIVWQIYLKNIKQFHDLIEF